MSHEHLAVSRTALSKACQMPALVKSMMQKEPERQPFGVFQAHSIDAYHVLHMRQANDSLQVQAGACDLLKAMTHMQVGIFIHAWSACCKQAVCDGIGPLQHRASRSAYDAEPSQDQ